MTLVKKGNEQYLDCMIGDQDKIWPAFLLRKLSDILRELVDRLTQINSFYSSDDLECKKIM